MLIVFDKLMCVSWALTYLLTLIATIKCKYPMISPWSQALQLPLEIAVLICFIYKGIFRFDYATVAYCIWIALEIVIIFADVCYGYLRKTRLLMFLGLFSICLVVFSYFIVKYNQALLFTYLITFIGETIWLKAFFSKDYPLSRFMLLAFISKFIGVAMVIPFYFGTGTWLTDLLSIALPVLDFAFIYAYFIKRHIVKGKAGYSIKK